MTDEMRRQVAQLLRNAVEHGGIAVAYDNMSGLEPDVHRLAVKARQAVRAEGDALDYDESCIEAARRIEEGRWP